MGEKTAIGWTATILPDGTTLPGSTFNSWWGCTKVSPGCDSCYASTFSQRYHSEVVWGREAPRRMMSDAYWQQPLKWNIRATKAGTHPKVFCASMADIFERRDTEEDNMILATERIRLWKLIEETPQLTWLLLTKRPENMRGMLPKHWLYTMNSFPHHVWLGTSVEEQRFAHKRIGSLLNIPTHVHFLSCEPLLGKLDLSPWLDRLEWVITGGESGNGFRPLDLDHVRRVRDQCIASGVPFFHKQQGGRTPHAGGRELDGRTWDEFPKIEQSWYTTP